MKNQSLRYIAIAIAIISAALLAMFLLQFNSSAAAQSNKNTRVPSSNGSSDNRMPSYPDTQQARGEEPNPEPQNSPGAGDKSVVSSVRFISTARYTRVLLDLSKEAKYEIRQLEGDPSKGLAPRAYVDILGARLVTNSKEPVAVHDRFLRQVRVGQYSDDVVRVVLDLNNITRSHAISLLPDLFRLVIHIQDQQAGEAVNSVASNKPAVAAVKNKTAARSSVSGIRKIVLDPGHGGKDPGAIGAGGIAEKDLVLAIAKKVALKLKKEMGIEVVLTRKDDRYIPLEDRTAVANAQDADLFISLHMNASPNLEARGIETYYLDNTNDEASIRLAARENSTSRKNVSDLQFILSDMMQNMKQEDSVSLAHRLQSALVNGMSRKLSDVRDLGVKKALFYVLVGARMPSVLVEMFFITNKIEGQAMSQESYQDAMVDALVEGVAKYNQGTMAMKTF
jgi:N-acetylmuramoyl-L-alanine amidase